MSSNGSKAFTTSRKFAYNSINSLPKLAFGKFLCLIMTWFYNSVPASFDIHKWDSYLMYFNHKRTLTTFVRLYGPRAGSAIMKYKYSWWYCRHSTYIWKKFWNAHFASCILQRLYSMSSYCPSDVQIYFGHKEIDRTENTYCKTTCSPSSSGIRLDVATVLKKNSMMEAIGSSKKESEISSEKKNKKPRSLRSEETRTEHIIASLQC